MSVLARGNGGCFCFFRKFVDVWEVRKQILYGDDACPSHLQSQSSVGDLGGAELMGRGVVSWTNKVSLHM